MKLALCTTTIHVPQALSLLRVFDPSVNFFVAGDEHTPDEVAAFCQDMDGCTYLNWKDQQESEWVTAKMLPAKTITRRNIAVLEALKAGADAIVSWDTDNIPLSADYFDRFSRNLTRPFSGIKAEALRGWFDPGELLQPRAPHRGFPLSKRGRQTFTSTVDAAVGVCAGMCLGDPDIGAVERIANAPLVHRASCLLEAGVVVDPRTTWTVFNTQNTAYWRELAPAMLLCPQFGRYDDIVASLITQRIMRERNLHVRFGQPFVWQSRNPHDLLRDLRDELWGMQHLTDIAELLDSDALAGRMARENPLTVSDQVRAIYDFMGGVFPAGVAELAEAWTADCARLGL